LRRNNNNGNNDNASSRNDDPDIDWYIASRAIMPFFDDVVCDEGVTPPPKRRRLHLNDMPDEVLIKVTERDKNKCLTKDSAGSGLSFYYIRKKP
jgi:hypothetical protein